MSIVKRFRY